MPIYKNSPSRRRAVYIDLLICEPAVYKTCGGICQFLDIPASGVYDEIICLTVAPFAAGEYLAGTGAVLINAAHILQHIAFGKLLIGLGALNAAAQFGLGLSAHEYVEWLIFAQQYICVSTDNNAVAACGGYLVDDLLLLKQQVGLRRLYYSRN